MKDYPSINYKDINEKIYPSKDREYISSLIEINNIKYVVDIVSLGLISLRITPKEDYEK